MNARYKVRRRGRGAVAKKVVLQPRPSPSMHKVPFAQELLAIRFTLLGVQLETLSFDILLSGDLGAISMDVGDYSSVSESDEGVVDKVAVNRTGVEDL